MWHVMGSQGCGNVLVEAALTLANVAFEHEEVDYAKPPAHLLAKNPLGQVPTVILPDGGVMTETAAIILHLDELHPEAGLLPARGTAERREALRWLVFLVAAVYPTWTYGDVPAKWIGEQAGPLLREATEVQRKKLWQQLEGIAKGPWFLGETRSILDVYVSVMTRWRPRREWFATATPRLHAIAVAIDADPRLSALWTANFPA